MDNKARFDQLESLLADLARKQDQQSGQIQQIIIELNRQGGAIALQGEAITELGKAVVRQETRLDNLSEQMGDILHILKISAAAHQETEKKQAEMLLEVREQGRRQDVALDAIKALLSRAEAVDKRVGGVIESQRQIIQLAQLNTESVEDHEPRIQRLEDEIFRQAN